MNRQLEDRPDLVQYLGDSDEPVLSLKAMAYLMGVTEAQVRAVYDAQGGKAGWITMPKEWIQRGKENAARLGTDNMAEALYLFALEREAELN